MSSTVPWQLDNPPTVREIVTDRLRAAVLDQEIRPGTRVRQTQLADALGVSRMPVRDAIQELLAEGLLQALPGGGVQAPPFDVADLLCALDLQVALEEQAVRTVARREVPAADLARACAGSDGLAFHRALGALADNRFLTAALTPIWAQAERATRALGPASRCRPGSPDHLAVADALVDGDLSTALGTLSGHLAAVRDEVAGWRGDPGRLAS